MDVLATALDAGFKPVPGGYIFTVQRMWGPRHFYLVNEGQKAELMARRREHFQRLQPLMLLCSVGLGVAMVAAAILFPFFGWLATGVFVLLILIICISWIAFANISTVRALEPLLATLPASPEPVAYHEELKLLIIAALSLSRRFLDLVARGLNKNASRDD
ncbi:MAG: hypothetical protein WBF58_04270 [Xanthobacteraceae bacterium]